MRLLRPVRDDTGERRVVDGNDLERNTLVDDHAPYTIALMCRSWPPVDAGEHHAVQSGIAEISVGDQARNKSFALTRHRQRIELARTAPVAITAREL